jgi:peptidoglycan/LPS O-acetylase OafA/YrhL
VEKATDSTSPRRLANQGVETRGGTNDQQARLFNQRWAIPVQFIATNSRAALRDHKPSVPSLRTTASNPRFHRHKVMRTETVNNGSNFRFIELDSVRALAAIWVFAYHVWQFGGSPELMVSLSRFSFDAFAPVHHGPAGVDVFMVLSGFCLFWPLTNNPNAFNWRSYALKRARRILPAYYGAIAYAILVPVTLVPIVRLAGWQANFQPVPSLRQIVSHLFLIHTLFRDTWDGITGAFWSMGLEAQFYLVFPFLALAWKHLGVRAVAYAALASVAFRIGVGVFQTDSTSIESFLLSITFLGRWMQFAAGMAAALWVRHQVNRPSRRLSAIDWTALTGASLILELAGLLAPSIVSQGPVPLRDILLATGSAGLLSSLCTAPHWIKSPFIRGPLPYLGRISYSFFLIHQPTSWYAMEFFRKKLGFSGERLVLVGYSAGFLATIFCASAFYRFFEKPFLNETAAPRENAPAPQRQTESVA